VDLILALVAALLFALGTVLQQKAGMDQPSEGATAGLLVRMARRPTWLAGIASDILGFFAQAAALGLGSPSSSRCWSRASFGHSPWARSSRGSGSSASTWLGRSSSWAHWSRS
jgi:hypothetical protein